MTVKGVLIGILLGVGIVFLLIHQLERKTMAPGCLSLFISGLTMLMSMGIALL